MNIIFETKDAAEVQPIVDKLNESNDYAVFYDSDNQSHEISFVDFIHYALVSEKKDSIVVVSEQNNIDSLTNNRILKAIVESTETMVVSDSINKSTYFVDFAKRIDKEKELFSSDPILSIMKTLNNSGFMISMSKLTPKNVSSMKIIKIPSNSTEPLNPSEISNAILKAKYFDAKTYEAFKSGSIVFVREHSPIAALLVQLSKASS